MKTNLRILSVLLALTMLLGVFLTSCERPPAADPSDSEKETLPETDRDIPDEEYELPLEEGYNQLTF